MAAAPGVTRRTLIAGAGGLLLAGCDRPAGTGPPSPSPVPVGEAPTPAAARAAYDAAAEVHRELRGEVPTNEAGRIAWDAAYALLSRLTLYRVTGDTRYLDEMVATAEAVLDARDQTRGLLDYRGRSLPAWGAAAPYTAGRLELPDAAGSPLFRIRALPGGKALRLSAVPVGDGSAADLSVQGVDGRPAAWRGVSADPSGPRYLPDVLLAGFPGAGSLTAEDLRPAGRRGPARFAPVDAEPTRYRYVFAAHTGMIAAPLAQLSSVVREDPALTARYRGPASRFLAAARIAVHLHDAEWQSTDAGGIYSFPRGAPVRGDGTSLPHNQYLALGRALGELSSAEPDPAYRTRARGLVATFVADLGRGTAPLWSYYWSRSRPYDGWEPQQDVSTFTPRLPAYRVAEDTAHGALDIECLVRLAQLGCGPGDAVLARLAQSFARRVVRRGPDGRLTSADSLGGGPRTGTWNATVPRWLGLAPWLPRARAMAVEVFANRPEAPVDGPLLASLAALLEAR